MPLPIVVAIAAPATPNAGTGPNPRINNGHKIIESEGLTGVVAYLNDVLVGGKNQQEHEENNTF